MSYSPLINGSQIQVVYPRVATPQEATPWYSSTASTACCYEQVAMQGPYPAPGTEDWSNTVVEVDPTQYSHIRYQMWITGMSLDYYPPLTGNFNFPVPIFRGMASASENNLSSCYYAEGVHPKHSIVGMPHYAGLTTAGASAYSGTSYWSSDWIAMSSIAGDYTGKLSATVEVYNDSEFRVDSSGYLPSRALWSAGLLTSLPEGAGISGSVQFIPVGTPTSYKLSNRLVRP